MMSANCSYRKIDKIEFISAVKSYRFWIEIGYIHLTALITVIKFGPKMRSLLKVVIFFSFQVTNNFGFANATTTSSKMLNLRWRV